MKKLVIITVFLFIYTSTFCQFQGFSFTSQAAGGYEILYKHRPDISDSTYQIFLHHASVGYYAHLGQGLGPAATRYVSFIDSCNYPLAVQNVTSFRNIGTGDNQFWRLTHNPYTGDTTGQLIFNYCTQMPNAWATAYQKTANIYMGFLTDSFALLKDYWVTTAPITLPEKCAYWQVSNNISPWIPNVIGGTTFGNKGYATNIDTLNQMNYCVGITPNSYVNSYINNNTPYFNSPLVAAFQKGAPATFKQNALDIDGDSLVFTSFPMYYPDTIFGEHPYSYFYPYLPFGYYKIPPDTMYFTWYNLNYEFIPGTPVRYNALNNPFDTDSTFTLDPHTGEIHFTGQSAFQSVFLNIRVDEYRNGVWVGAVHRLLRFFIYDSYYVNPNFYIDSTQLVNCIKDTGNTIYACVGLPISFPYHIWRNNAGTKLEVSDNHGNILPLSNTNYLNNATDSVSGIFQWTPTITDTGWHTITVSIEDTSCNLTPYYQHYEIPLRIKISAGTGANKDTFVCAGQSVQLNTNMIGNIQWSILSGTPNSLSCTNCNNPIATPTVTTTYVVSSNANLVNCVNVDTVTVKVYNDFTLLPISDILLCKNQNSLVLKSNVIGNTSTLNYLWTPAAAIIGSNTKDSAVVNPNLATQFIVIVSDSAGCFTHQDTVNIIYDQNFNPFILASKAGICLGDTAQLQVLGIANASMAWNPPYHISNLTGNVVQVWPDSTVTYFVTVSSNVTPCTVVLNQTVQVTELRADAGPDYDIFDGEAVVLGGPGMRCNNGCKLQWYPDKWMFFNFYENPKVVPHETTKYWVVLSDEWGTCVDRDTVEVRVTCNDIYMPNVFSPESQSEHNIRYGPRNVGLEYKYFYIYNRWGEMVFASYSNRDRWDGKHNGKDQPTGVYVWVIEAKCNNGQWIKKSGNVTLIR